MAFKWFRFRSNLNICNLFPWVRVQIWTFAICSLTQTTAYVSIVRSSNGWSKPSKTNKVGWSNMYQVWIEFKTVHSSRIHMGWGSNLGIRPLPLFTNYVHDESDHLDWSKLIKRNQVRRSKMAEHKGIQNSKNSGRKPLEMIQKQQF